MISRIFKIYIKLTKLFSRKNLYKFFKKELISLPKNINILNVGSGGDIEKIIQASISGKITSIDIDPERKPDIVGDICNYIIKKKEYDCICVMETLEHVKSPKNALENLYLGLKKGGKLILSTPFMMPIHDAPYDYFRYTKYGLKFLLEEKGFRNIEIKERNNYVEMIYVFIARIFFSEHLTDRALAVILFPLSLIIFPIIRIISKLIKTKSGTTGYFVTAKK